MAHSPEGLQKSGEDFLLKTKQYLEGTLVIQVLWTVYDNNGQTVLRGLDDRPYAYDALARLKEGSKQPIYIEAKSRSAYSDINAEYDTFVAKSFSCFLKETSLRPGWDAYFMFVTNHPFKARDYGRLLELDYLLNFLGQARGRFGIGQASVEQVNRFKDKLWLVIWSNKQDLMCVSDPSLYRRLNLEGRAFA